MKRYQPSRNWWRIRPLLAAAAIAVGLAGMTLSSPAMAAEFTVYKSPWCGCCEKWVEHLQANGHTVVTKNVENLDAIKKMAGVPEDLQSCHTAKVDGYVIEGHVPAQDIARLLTERPNARGLAAPGMPAGSPGMSDETPEGYDVMLFQSDGSASIYQKY